MGSRLHSVVVDAADPARLARWWAEVLDYQIVDEEHDEVSIAPDKNTYPNLVFGLAPDAKTIKNRLHLDLNPDDQEAEVERLVDMGAHPVDVGQTADVTWVVLADPEGNEFCVLSARSQ
jgi:predicted enzyme related to lactoylglutathione lyase